jgi:hypothetical protein
MMRKLALVGIAAAAVAGAAYYGVVVYPNQRFRNVLDQQIAKLPDGFTASYKGATYSLISDRAVVTGLTLHGIRRGPQPEDFDLAAGEVDLLKPDLDFSVKWSTAAADPAALGPATVLPLADRITVRGYAFRSGAMSGGNEVWQLTKPRLYPWALLQDGVPSLAQALTTAQNLAQPPQLDQMLSLLKFEAACMLAIGYDDYTASNMKLVGTVPAVRDLPATDVSMTLRRVSGGYDRGVIKAGLAEGLAVDLGDHGSFAIDRLVMADIVLQKPLIEFLSAPVPSPAMLDGVKIGRVEYGGMTIKPPGAATPIILGTVSLDHFGFSHGMPISGALSWRGLHVERAQMPTPSSQASFDTLGLDAMTASIAVAYDWDVERKRLTLHDTMLKVDELGSLALSAEITDVAQGVASPDAAQIAHARLRFEDASLIDRWLRTTAARTHAEPEALRRQLIATLPQQAALLGPYNPSVPVLAKAVADFLAAPQSLTVEMAPPAPLALATLRQAAALPPAALFAMLGLTVTANQ